MDSNKPSVTINIPKPRVYTRSSNDLFQPMRLKSVLKQIKNKRSIKNSELVIRKYSSPCDILLPAQHYKKEELLLSYKAYLKAQQRNTHKEKLATTVRNNYNTFSTDMKQWLHTEYFPDDVQALTDMDKDFFNCISGRPLPDRFPLYKSLKTAISDLLRIKQEIGNRRDAILNIEVNSKQELQIYNKCLRKCTQQVKYFDTFISEDYQKSMAFLEEWDNLREKVNVKVVELHHLANEEFTTISKLLSLDYMYGLQQKYGRFLYYLSPPSWRAKNRDFAKSVEIEAKGFDLGHESEDEKFNVVFDKMRKECFSGFIKPALYFTKPHELLDIFSGFENQQLHHYSYITHLAPHKKMLKDGIKLLKDIIRQESVYVANTIQGLQKLIEDSEERCVQLKSKFFRILNGLFYESVGVPEVLKLSVHLEFCYERVFAEKAMNLSIVTIAKSLEAYYMDYSKQLDKIQSHTIKQAVVKCMEMEKRKIRRAKLATRELSQFDRLERDLLRAHTRVSKKPQQHMPWLGNMISKTNKQGYSKPQCLSVNTIIKHSIDESEQEYLTLFTDWVEGDDPTKYLHRLEE